MKKKRPAKRISEKYENKSISAKEEDLIKLISETIVNIIIEDDDEGLTKSVQSKNTKSPKGNRTQGKSTRK